MLDSDANELKKTSYAVFVLYIGNDNQIWQANLSYLIAGATVVRTLAWKPEDLQKYFSDCRFDGKRLVVKTNGSYSESEKAQDRLALSWMVRFESS